ncbi:MAG: hypothetical protein J6J03_06840, partial [Tyzzerella sp.]|nr:hypothetical protein [Tyzzerella sp.]
YDLCQYIPRGDKILAHVVKQNASPQIDDAMIVWFDAENGEMHEIEKTGAWCWQQGSRLRWHPKEQDTILFNDLDHGEYVTKKVNLINGIAERVSRALYDVDTEFKYGLALNFSRLQRLRPGYGYSRIGEKNADIAAPADDGVFRVDMHSGDEVLLFSLKDLAKDVSAEGFHYINHLSISPSGKRFTFFHLWTLGAKQSWKMRFYVANADGSGLTLLDDEYIISHYCWVNDRQMIVTDTKGKYIWIDTVSGEKKVIVSEHLNKDGHPSWMNRGFLTDTYPQGKKSMQHVFRMNESGSEYLGILKVFSDPRRYGEKRCDLHPRVTSDGKVTIDTTALGGVRSILAFKLKESEM